MKAKLCELCNEDAAVFCSSDAAFLCWSCDAKIHEANFLVARHVRQPICSNCKNFTGEGVSGAGFLPFLATCPSCPPASAVDDDLEDSLSSSGSSVCISRTTSRTNENSSDWGFESSPTISSGKRHRQFKGDPFRAEGIFVNWCGKLGIEVDLVVGMARKALKVCLDRWTVLPFRVCLAASMWLGVKLSLQKSVATCKVLKRLEEISGVPTKIIVIGETKLKRALNGGRDYRRIQLELKEGWAES